MARPNWLRVPNPFQLTPPPAWWLQEMRVFDPQLVVFPSQKRMTFILARRATRSKGESPHDVKGLTQNPDTLIMASNRLVRVCEILPGVIWDQRVFRKLAAHDIQRLGGASEVANQLDAADSRRDAQIQRAQEDEIHARSTDAYRSFKTRIGERLSLALTKHGRGDIKKTPVSINVRAPQSVSPPAPRIVLAT